MEAYPLGRLQRDGYDFLLPPLKARDLRLELEHN